MNYESKCIRDIITDEINKIIYLPAIQREFVWDTEMVEKLFDSIMGDYPISSFLFWKIKEENKKDWTSYEFIRNFNDAEPYNNEADLSGVNKDVYFVLDGQQRLTALYIGLKGTFTYFYYRTKETKLYLNLLKEPIKNEDDPTELTYRFQFRENPEPDDDQNEHWYLVSRILDFEDAEDAKDDIDKEIAGFTTKQITNAKKLIGQLHSRIHTHKLINYYEEKSQDYDKVVEVFIRANTGGKKLDYSDILLSTATAKWKTLNAREELQEFTESINNIGNGYEFEKDFVLKGSLYLTEDLPIQYKIKNFTTKNLEKIETNWTEIKENIESTINLVSKFGFSNKNITSASALLPISFFIRKLNKKNFVLSSSRSDVELQNTINIWLILALLKNAFGSSSDTTLKNLRDILLAQPSFSEFPFEDLNKSLEIEPKFSDVEIDTNLNINYKTKYSYLALSLLYPNRDWKDNTYHEDHIFPKSQFTSANLRKKGIPNDKIESYMKSYNTISNLQLLTNSENLEKNAKPFDEWINTRDENFKERHTIPDIPDYSLSNFIEFIEERKKMLRKKFKKIVLH